jgi:hypothetical protein
MNIDITKDIPDDVLYSIVLQMTPKQITRLCQTNKYFYNKLCTREFRDLWTRLYEKWISKLRLPKNPRQEFYKIMTELNAANIDQAAEISKFNGYEVMFYNIMTNQVKTGKWNGQDILVYIGTEYPEIIKMIINQLKDLNSLETSVLNEQLLFAAEKNNIDLIYIL